jgi:hypothetical protein
LTDRINFLGVIFRIAIWYFFIDFLEILRGNVSLDMKIAIHVVDDEFVASRIQKLMEIQGEVGFIIKVGLFSDLRES